MRKELRRKIEEIIDVGEGPSRQVIIRAKDRKEEVRPVLAAAASAIRQRQFAGSARDILPAKGSTLKSPSGASARSTLQRHTTSLASQSALRVAPKLALKQIRDYGETATSVIRKMKSVAKADAGQTEASQVTSLWIANSVVATLDKDDLARLPEESDVGIEVYTNNRVALPVYSRTQSLPANVIDNKTSAWGVQAIGALSAWGAYGARGQGVKVAVLDTGVDANHPDIVGKLAGFAEFDSFGNQVVGALPHDSGEHGTHVAGTVLGGNAGGSRIGVAPDAQLLAGLVLPGGSGTDAQIIAGMQWALEQGADVINMSLSGLTFEPEVPGFYTEAIVNALLAGTPVVTAIGNDGDQVTGPPANDLLAFAVGATDPNDEVTGFSGGRTHALTESDIFDPNDLPIIYMKPDVSAPGFAIRSSVPGGAWEAFNGTSMATPHVAGAVAVLLSGTSIRDDLDGPDRAFLILDLLAGSAEELGERGQDQRFGFGRIDVLRAVGMAHELGFGSGASA